MPLLRNCTYLEPKYKSETQNRNTCSAGEGFWLPSLDLLQPYQTLVSMVKPILMSSTVLCLKNSLGHTVLCCLLKRSERTSCCCLNELGTGFVCFTENVFQKSAYYLVCAKSSISRGNNKKLSYSSRFLKLGNYPGNTRSQTASGCICLLLSKE